MLILKSLLGSWRRKWQIREPANSELPPMFPEAQELAIIVVPKATEG